MRLSEKRNIKAIVIGGSAGSFPILGEMFASLKAPFKVPIIVAPHRLKHVRHGFTETLNLKSSLEIVEPLDKEKVQKNKIYIAPSNYHMALNQDFTFSCTTDEMILSSRPSIDITLSSVAEVYKEHTLGILLTGANRDGAAGMKTIVDRGGVTIVQDPDTCLVPTMPKAALAATSIHYKMDVAQIIETLNSINRL